MIFSKRDISRPGVRFSGGRCEFAAGRGGLRLAGTSPTAGTSPLGSSPSFTLWGRLAAVSHGDLRPPSGQTLVSFLLEVLEASVRDRSHFLPRQAIPVYSLNPGAADFHPHLVLRAPHLAENPSVFLTSSKPLPLFFCMDADDSCSFYNFVNHFISDLQGRLGPARSRLPELRAAGSLSLHQGAACEAGSGGRVHCRAALLAFL